MASATVVAAIRAILEAAAARPVFGPNERMAAPADGGRFVAFRIPVGDERLVGLGGVGRRLFREEGAILVVVLEPRGDGVAGALALAETLRAALRATRVGALVTHAPSSPTVDDGPDRGAHAHVSFAVPFHLDITA